MLFKEFKIINRETDNICSNCKQLRKIVQALKIVGMNSLADDLGVINSNFDQSIPTIQHSVLIVQERLGDHE